MTRLHQHTKLSLKKVNRNLFFLLLLIIFSYFIVQIGITSIVGTKGEALDQIRQEKDQLRRENEIVSAKIDKLKSISSTQELSKKLDLKNKKVNFLPEADQNNVALGK